MKKSNLFILSITALICMNLNSQNLTGKIEYSVNSFKEEKKIDNQRKKMNPEVKELITKVNSKSKDLKLLLVFNQDISFFTSPEPLNINMKEERLFKLAKVIHGVIGDYYYIAKKKKLIADRDFLGERFLVEENLKSREWKLINETKKIGKYTCFKAERYKGSIGRNGKMKIKQVVWYTMEIPLPYGPKDFVGLPGLVIRAFERNLIYSVKKIELNSKKKIKIEIPNKGKKVTKEEYDKIVEGSSSEIRLMLKRKVN